MINDRRLLSLGLALVAVLWLTACPKTYPPPTDQIRDPAELRTAVDAAISEVGSARFKNVRLDYFGEEGRLTVRQLILYAAPDKLRIQTYIPGFDGIAGVLVCACGKFAYHDRREDRYFYGDSTAQNVGRVLPVGLTCRDVGALMLGAAPNDKLSEAGGEEALEWDESTGRYRLSVPVKNGPDRGNTIEMQIRHGDWRLAELRTVDGAGAERFVYTAKDFETLSGLLLPTKRRFVVADRDDDFSLTGDEVELNPELPDALFGLAPPSGTKVSYVGTGPRPEPVEDLCAQP